MKRRGSPLLPLLLLAVCRLTTPLLAVLHRTTPSVDLSKSQFPSSGRSPARIDTHLCNIRLYASSKDENDDSISSSAPKLDFNECFYSVLETVPTASSAVLKKAYYQMVFKYHPDNIKDEDPQGALKRLRNQQMMVINAAYKVLRDAELRQIYDQERRLGRIGAQAKIPKGGKGGVKEKRSAPSSPDDRSNGEPEVDEMGWRRKWTNKEGQRQYSDDASNSKDEDDWEVDEMGWRVKKTRQSDKRQNSRYDNDDGDLEEMLRQGWFDEDFKNRLLRRRVERQRAESTGNAGAVRPRSVFEEIKEMLREDDREHTERRSSGSSEESYRYRTEPIPAQGGSQNAKASHNVILDS
jgi:curved DNA-binding protein CbpA